MRRIVVATEVDRALEEAGGGGEVRTTKGVPPSREETRSRTQRQLGIVHTQLAAEDESLLQVVAEDLVSLERVSTSARSSHSAKRSCSSARSAFGIDP